MMQADVSPPPSLTARLQAVTPAAWLVGTLIAILLLLTAVTMTQLVEQEPLISDSIGYLYAAQRIAAGFGPTYDDPNNVLAGPYFSLYAFQVRRPDSALMYLGFPPGLSLMLAIPLLAEPLAGLVHWVIPATALLCLGLSGVLAWRLTRRPWAAFWAVLILAVTPELWRFGTAIWSEFPSAAMITATLALYLAAERRAFTRRAETALLTLAGLLLGYSIFVRYSNLVVLPVFLLADALLIRKQPHKLASHWPLWLLTGLTVVLIPVFNHVYYGGWNLTSYSPVHGWYPNPAFALHYALGPSFIDGYSLREAITTLWRNFGVFLVLAPLGWFYLGRAGAIPGGIALMILGVHAVYAFAPTGINARFLIPIFPMIAIGAAAALVNLGDRLPRPLRLVVALGLLVLAVWQAPANLDAIVRRNQDNARHVALMQTLTTGTPEDAVFMSYPWNDLLAVYGDRSVFTYRRVPVSDAEAQRYHIDAAVSTIVSVITTLLEQGKPVYYVATGSDFIPGLPDTLQEHFAAEAVTVEGVPLLRLTLAP